MRPKQHHYDKKPAIRLKAVRLSKTLSIAFRNNLIAGDE